MDVDWTEMIWFEMNRMDWTLKYPEVNESMTRHKKK